MGKERKFQNRLLFLFPDIESHQCVSVALVKNAVLDDRVREMFFTAPGDFKGALFFQFSVFAAQQRKFAAPVVVIQHVIGCDDGAGSGFQ